MTARLADVGSLDRSACRASVAGRFSVQQSIDRHAGFAFRFILCHAVPTSSRPLPALTA